MRRSDAWEWVGEGDAPWLFTCEHASARLPEGRSWAAEDAWVASTHWAVDLGAADVAVGVARALGGEVLLARFSRLWADANREETSPTLFRLRCDGRELTLNRDSDAAERARRLDGWWRPWHAEVASAARRRIGQPVVSFHSFTPVYEGGPPRPMAVGVLFDRDEAWATALARVIQAELGPSYAVALNEPWSGRDGLMAGPEAAAQISGGRVLEFEVRQDLATDPAHRARIVAAFAAALASTPP